MKRGTVFTNESRKHKETFKNLYCATCASAQVRKLRKKEVDEWVVRFAIALDKHLIRWQMREC
jgi:hypothetical protein